MIGNHFISIMIAYLMVTEMSARKLDAKNSKLIDLINMNRVGQNKINRKSNSENKVSKKTFSPELSLLKKKLDSIAYYTKELRKLKDQMRIYEQLNDNPTGGDSSINFHSFNENGEKRIEFHGDGISIDVENGKF